MAQSSVSQQEIEEKEERVWADVNESQKFVNEKGKVKCKYCSEQETCLKVTSNDISLQDVPYVTNADKDGKVNFKFKGTCGHPSQQKPSGPPPCLSVVKLAEWKDYAEVHVNDDYALIVKSTIPCMISNEDIIITDSGQIAELAEIDPISNLRTRVKIEANFEVYTSPNSFDVCKKACVQAIYLLNSEETDNENITWQVEVFSGKMYEDENGRRRESSKIYNLEDVKLEKNTLGKLEGKPLSEKKDADPKDVFKLKGNEICFNVPKEWGKKKVRFIATLEEENLEAISRTIDVKDHIVAAFFRINPDIPKKSRLNDIKEAENNYKNLVGPVHHHQGLYKTGNSFYVSGSTRRDVPSYVYQISENEDNTFGYRETTWFNKGVLNYYRHSGGLQIAKGLMAIGIEEYNYNFVDIEDKKIKFGIFGSAVYDHSVVCFFEGNEEKRHLRIVRDNGYLKKVEEIEDGAGNINNNEEPSINERLVGIDEKKNDYASAVGLIFWKNKYIVAVRGGKKAVSFYEIDEGLKGITPLWSKEKVGEFQNLNLHQNEEGDIYMFGMEVGSSPDPFDPIYYVADHICKIYRVNMEGEEIESVWISEKTGELKDEIYTKEKKKNSLKFNCLDDISFKWASCVHLGDNKGNDLTFRHEDDSFKGKLTLHVVNRKVLKHRKIDTNFIHCHSFTEDE